MSRKLNKPFFRVYFFRKMLYNIQSELGSGGSLWAEEN